MAFRHGRPILGGAIAALALAATHAASSASAPPRWIVFSAQPDGTALAQLFRVQTTGDGLQQITTGNKSATDPAFSPDGTRIVFSRLGSGIFRVNLDGTGLRRLTSGPRDAYPVWSPDSRRIAFIRPYRTQWRVHVLSASGGAERRLPLAPPAGRPSWTADGKAIFIPTAGELAKLDSQTGKVQKYFDLALDPSTAQAATVSPDARTVAFLGKRTPTSGPPNCGESHCPTYVLYLAGVSGTHRRRIAKETGPAGWSPDGKTLVFVSRGGLTLSAVGNGNTTMIATGTYFPASDAPPAWQPR